MLLWTATMAEMRSPYVRSCSCRCFDAKQASMSLAHSLLCVSPFVFGQDLKGEAIFKNSLFVLSSVQTISTRGWAVCDAGTKAVSLDSGPPMVSFVGPGLLDSFQCSILYNPIKM